jgi:ADP-heptose:LPS heptosyltransferase
MQEVIDQLALDTTNTILLLAVEQIEILDSLAANKKRHQYGGKLKLQQELQLISNLDVMLSMDSGMHIAAMLGVKVITLWGAHIRMLGFTL